MAQRLCFSQTDPRTPIYEIPGTDISCLDAAEMLVDGFIRDAGLLPLPSDRNELVRRVGTLLSMQREALREEFKDLRESARKAHFALQLGHNDYTDYGLTAMLKEGKI